MQPLAYQSVGTRFAAQLVDGLFGMILFYVVGGFIADAAGGRTESGFELSGGPALALMLVMLVCWVAYFALLEGFWNGQTVGKRLVGIQVVKDDGQPIDLPAAMIRNIVRPIDAFGVYLVAAVLVWSSSTRQRFGDRLAHTVVIKRGS